MSSLSSLSVDILKKGTLEKLPILHHNGTQYLVAEPGVEFEVKALLENNTGEDYKVQLSIDGTNVGYSKILSGHYRHSDAVFKGYLQSMGAGNGPMTSTYRAFKFGACKPAEDADTVEHPDEIKAGKIDIEWMAVVAVGSSAPAPVLPVRVVSDAASKKKLPEGKKWFLAPGLKAEAGGTVVSKTYWNYNQYDTVEVMPTIRLRYDTSENLYLRKVLNLSNPAHRAILRSSPNERIAALGLEPSEASSRQQLQQQQRGIKREGAAAAGVKRERGEGSGVPLSATAQRVDLTGDVPVGPLMVGGQVVGADELAVCDLCDSDDEPSWQVQKKQAVEVQEV